MYKNVCKYYLNYLFEHVPFEHYLNNNNLVSNKINNNEIVPDNRTKDLMYNL